MDSRMLMENSLYLASLTAALEVPVVLSTIHKKNSGVLNPEIRDLFPGVASIDRSSRNAWSDPAFLAGVKKAGRKKLVIAGLLTEICLCFTVLSALGAGYEVYVVVDASGGTSDVAHDAAVQRMILAGAVPVSVQQVMAEYAESVSSPEKRRALVPIIERYAGGFGQMFIFKDYISSGTRD
jgi:nicotinamidase-related amidase